MKHYLRFLISLLVATVWCMGGYGQETAYKVLSFPPDNKDAVGNTSYQSSSDYTIGNDTWTVSNFNNNKWNKGWENLIKCGRKSSNSVATISTKNAYDNAINKIVVNLSALSSDLNSLKMEMSSDKDYSNIIQTISLAYDNLKTGDNEFVIKSPQENCFYRLTFDCNCTNKKNGYAATVLSVKYYSVADTRTIPVVAFDDASIAGTTIDINEGETFPTHVATCTTDGVTGTISYSSDNACVKVDQNGVTSAGIGFGKAKITATFTPDDTYKDTYAESSAFYYINYIEKQKTPTTLSFEKSSVALTTLDYSSFTGQKSTLKSGDTELTGKSIVYSKTDANNVISTLNEDGTLVLSGKAGTATVTATFGGDGEYSSSTASYTISVKSVVKDIATLKPLITSTSKNPQSFTLKLTDAIVTYVNKNTAYIQDASSAICVYASSHGLLNNQKINGLVDVGACLFNGLPEIVSWTLESDAEVTDNASFDVETVTLADLVANYSKYESKPVKVAGAVVTKEFDSKNNGEISQDGVTYAVYNKGASSVSITEGDNIDIIGYPTIFNNTYSLYLWKQSNVTVNYSQVATTLSLDPATTEYTVEKGKEDAFTAPKVIVTDANDEPVADAKISYKSSNTNVATVDAETGKVAFGNEFGTTTITVSYAGDATHKAATDISYNIVYSKVATEMKWSVEATTAKLGEEFTAPTLSLTADGESILEGKTITYESTDENVAIVDEDGSVVLMDKEGTTTITAKFAGDDMYAEAEASYTLTVVDPNKIEAKFDFLTPSKYGYGTTSGTPDYGKGEGDVLENASIKESDVTLINTTVTGSGTRFYSDGLRVYSGNIHTLSVPAGYRIISVAFDFAASGSSKSYRIEDASANSSWTGSKRSVLISYTGTNKKITSLTVTYKKVDLPSVSLNEEDNDIAILENENKQVNVNVARSMTADGGWYTLCLPFDIDDVTATPLKNAEIRQYKSMSGSIMNFETTTSMKAMHAYLIKPISNIENPKFDDVTIVSESNGIVDGENGYKFVGICSKYPLATDGTNLFLGAENKFYVPTEADKTLKALRGYFVAPSADSGAKMGISIDGETTSISALNNGKAMLNGKVYNLNGQYVGNDIKALQKGVYVVNGRKYIVK